MLKFGDVLLLFIQKQIIENKLTAGNILVIGGHVLSIHVNDQHRITLQNNNK